MWFDGRYGAPTQRRQRYVCIPPNGEPRHRFTETLPRIHGGTGECLECERHFEAHEGKPSGRYFNFAARDIAKTLISVGQGMSDRRAGLRIRMETKRLLAGRTPSGRKRRNNDGNTVADWVELFAPPIFETRRPTEWPMIVAFDSIPFAIKRRDPVTGQPIRGGKTVLNILAAYGWPNAAVSEGSGRVLALRAYPNFAFNQGFIHWLDFFQALRAELRGRPHQIVCDQDREILRALDRVWPRGKKGSPTVYICHWHMREKIRGILDPAKVPYPDPLREAIDHKRGNVQCMCAFCDPHQFDLFEVIGRARNIPKLTNWFDRNSALVRWQLAHRYKPFRARLNVGPIEQILAQIRDDYHRRAGTIHNQERMNRRLMLAQMELNHQADESHYSKVIREVLLANDGFGGERYVIDDKAGSSLRIY